MAQTRKATRMPAGLTGTMHGMGDLAERATGAVAALTRMAEQRAAGYPRAVGQLAVELIAEHVRHGRAVAILIDRDPERDGARRIQEDFVRTSLVLLCHEAAKRDLPAFPSDGQNCRARNQ